MEKMKIVRQRVNLRFNEEKTHLFYLSKKSVKIIENFLHSKPNLEVWKYTYFINGKKHSEALQSSSRKAMFRNTDNYLLSVFNKDNNCLTMENNSDNDLELKIIIHYRQRKFEQDKYEVSITQENNTIKYSNISYKETLELHKISSQFLNMQIQIFNMCSKEIMEVETLFSQFYRGGVKSDKNN